MTMTANSPQILRLVPQIDRDFVQFWPQKFTALLIIIRAL